MARSTESMRPLPRKYLPAQRNASQTKKHRFEPFSQRIARLKIDPVRRSASRHALDASDSFFKSSLESWIDLNLSAHFTAFCKRVEPYCDSLPQIIHHADDIASTLVSYLQNGTEVSLEPLLDLVAQLAHDLGQRFEIHFSKIVETISHIASSNPHVQVIEWSFNCLAWLFKYLSRLLVPDLRPLFDLIAPLLGQERQKEFVTRFAAEAFSYLIRRASISYHKDKEPLRRIVKHILSKVLSAHHSGTSSCSTDALCTLFGESIKGVNGELSSNGDIIFHEILSQYLVLNDTDSLASESVFPILKGILDSMIVYSTSKAFRDILRALISNAHSNKLDYNEGIEIIAYNVNTLSQAISRQRISTCVELLLLPVCANEGEVIEDWGSIFSFVELVVGHINSYQELFTIAPQILSLLAASHGTAPIDASIPHNRVFQTISNGSWTPYFLGVCEIYAQLDHGRFLTFLQPYFKSFVDSNWLHYQDHLCIILSNLVRKREISTIKFRLPTPWLEEFLINLNVLLNEPTESRLSVTDIYRLSAMMDIVHVLGKDDSIQERISTALLELLLATKTTTSGLADVIETFVFGQVLKFVSNGKLLPSKTSELWISICQASRNQWRHEIFWTSALSFAKVRLDDTIKCSESDEEILKNSVLQALESPSHFMRQNVLGLAKMLSKTHSGEELSLLDVALSIEETPLSLESIRHVSMQMRRLTTMYTEFSQSKDSWVLTAIRAYSFGLLRVNFAPLWSDVCSILQQICQHKQGETHVSEIAFRWLENRPINSFVENIPQEAPRMTQNKAKGDIYAKYQALIHNAWDSSSRTIQIEEEFHNIHQETVFESRLDRSQALRLLNVISEAAEKKSKQLVPVLLNWISDDLLEDENTEGHSENVQQRSWNRKEKKELLSLFSKFSNPKALYKSQEVYTALLSLLTHADIEIQKHAFIAILTWKNRVVVEYKDPILQFFDEANFKEQISVFLSTGHGEEILKAEHRSEIMPIILRILYGRLTKRGTGDQQSNRKAVFGLLAGLNNEETECFLNIALGPLANLQLLNGNNLDESTLSSEVIVPRKQVGLLTMLKDMLETLGTKASTFVPWFVNPIIYCLLRAENHLISVSVGNDGTVTIAGKGIFKSIRLVALTCLINLFPISASFDWKPYLPLLFRDLISPRLEKLASETTQGVSSLLRLFATWANTLSCAHFLWKYNFTLLSRLAECVGYSATKDEVKCFILRDIFLPLIQLCIEDPTQDEIKQTLSLLSTYMLEQLNEAMNSDCSMEFLEQSIKVIVNLVHIVPISSPKILTTSASLLRQPARRVNFENKIQLLRILNNMIPSKEMHEELQANVDLFDDIFNVTCSSFSLVSVGIGRTLLCGILCQLATLDTSLAQISSLVEDLNSFSESRLEEPDFEKRTKAFYTINEELYPILSPRQWAPLISNALYYVKDVDELAIRASASHSIRRFIEAASEKENEERQKCFQLLETSILPAVETAIRKEPEIVRIEYLQMLAHAAQYFPEWKPISDLQYLRWGGDADEDEASFFNNILHIQHHRRIRAIKRLSEEAEKGTLTGRSISHLLVPLLERFIFDSTDGLLAAEASKTIGALAEWMDFPQYRILLKRYISYIHSKLDIQERVLKVLNYASTALTNCARSKIIDTPKTKLMKSLPGEQNLPRIISNEFLPPFYKFLQEKDESFVSRRIAAATIATRIMQVLPEAEFALRFPPLLIDTCGILRSRDQSSRDATRNVLSEICSLVGPSAIGFVVTELRRILHRGFFLHVLGFTVHSILESTVSNFKPGDLDYCVSDITAVIMDDIFGAAGQEKEVADYLKMNNGKREVKSRKSFDTMQLLATVTTLPHLIELVKPIQMLLLEQLGQKALRNVDELFRRIEIGVLKNASIQDRDILIFCYQIIQDAYNFNSNGIKSTTTLNSGEAVHQSKHNKSTSQAKQHTKVGKIVRFGLELVRSILKKHKDLKTPANISGFLPMIRDALNQGEEDIKMAAIRLFTAIIGVPVSGIDTDATQVIKSAMQIIQDSTSTNDELSQAALKLIAATLKERKSVDIPEVSVALLLKAIKPDLQVINHQGAAFNLIKAILSRKFIMTEVYELIDGDDGIAAISIRDHDRTTRDLARGVYFQFLMDYPQGKKRFGKQLTFLIHNLEYEYPEGRQSVMEALNLLLNKVNDNFVQDIVRESFWPVVSILINDNNNDCRTMAHGLVKTIFSRADDEWCRGFLILLRKMLSVSSQNIQKRTAIQCWTAYAEVKAGGVEGVEFMLQSIEEIFQHKGDVEDIWQLFYYAMLALLVICQHLPQVVFRGQWKSLWMSIWQKLSFPHSWVKLEATKAIWGLITTFEKSNMTKESLPLTLSTGLKLTASDLCDLTYRHLRILREGITPELASQTIENLTFLGECFGTSKMHWISTITSQPNLYSESEANSEDNDEPLISKSSVGTEILAIRYLFTRLSAIVRKESQRRRSNADEVLSRRSYSLLPRLSALQLLQCLSTVLAPSIVEPSLVMILRPLVHLTDTAISAPVSSEDAFNESYKELVSGATALIDTLQKQFGTSDFVKALGEVKENITEQREERRRKRKIVAVSMPEVKERRKAKKREKEKVRRKEKNLVARGKRRGW